MLQELVGNMGQAGAKEEAGQCRCVREKRIGLARTVYTQLTRFLVIFGDLPCRHLVISLPKIPKTVPLLLT